MEWNAMQILKAIVVDEYLLMWKIFTKVLKKPEDPTWSVTLYLFFYWKISIYIHTYSHIRNTYACIYTHNEKHLK